MDRTPRPRSSVATATPIWSCPNRAVIVMDALASDNHIGMIYQANTAYNTDRIVEAKCEACGTGIWTRTYRGDPSYGGVRRAGWSH